MAAVVELPLMKLVIFWENKALRLFMSAEHEQGMERKALEFGAMCYRNCAEDLRKVARLSDLRLQPLLKYVDGKACSAIQELGLRLGPESVVLGGAQEVVTAPGQARDEATPESAHSLHYLPSNHSRINKKTNMGKNCRLIKVCKLEVSGLQLYFRRSLFNAKQDVTD